MIFITAGSMPAVLLIFSFLVVGILPLIGAGVTLLSGLFGKKKTEPPPPPPPPEPEIKIPWVPIIVGAVGFLMLMMMMLAKK